VEWLRVLAKMASGSGKRSRLHRGFSNGQVALHHSAKAFAVGYACWVFGASN